MANASQHDHRGGRGERGRNREKAAFNRRKRYDENLQSIFRDTILAAPSELFEIADYGAVKELLSRHPPTWPTQVWNLYTVAVLLSGSWRRPDPDLPTLRLRVPPEEDPPVS